MATPPGNFQHLVSLILSEQVEETITLDVTGMIHTTPSIVMTMRDHEGESGWFARPDRIITVLLMIMFVAKADGELTEVDFWNLYKGRVFPILYRTSSSPGVLSDVTKNVSVVFLYFRSGLGFSGRNAKVHRAGSGSRKVSAAERFKCLWNRTSHSALHRFSAPGDLFDHILDHIEVEDSTRCEPPPKSTLRPHVLKHISSPQPPGKCPSQSDTLPSADSPYPINDATSQPPSPVRGTTRHLPRSRPCFASASCSGRRLRPSH
ncbi:hypothetical protein C8R44DRAFT_927370 [Mycena epipterygia]|nr:hypothetical protein C8R44DRAFT_927370 [Mycena epipterygia]